MDTPAQDFEADWNREQGKLRNYFLRRGFTSTDVDDPVQEVAMRLWQRYSKKGPPEDASRYSMAVAKNVLYGVYINKKNVRYDFYRDELRPRFQVEPPEYFEKQTIPFADVWGREVPSTRWDRAEEFSLTPFRLAEALDEVVELLDSEEDRLIAYYLFREVSPREISRLAGLPLSLVYDRIKRINHLSQRKLLTARQFRSVEPRIPPSLLVGPLSIVKPIGTPNAASYLRRLPGYVPEWNLWFARLSNYTTHNADPITFGVIERIARATRTLSEDQGKRFLLAAMSNRGGLLTQKFFQIAPRGEPRSLSFSDIARLLKEQSAAADTEWMDQIATAWEPTSKWRELTARYNYV